MERLAILFLGVAVCALPPGLRTTGVADAQGLGPSKNMGLNYDGTYAGARLSALFVYDGLDDHQHEERLETRLHL